MIKSIKIKDYMAHKDSVLELSPGVTVLTGPNNSGKSAVVEALRSVAQNPSPRHVIRHGAARAVVRVELDSGDTIEWVRSRGNTVYRLSKSQQEGDSSEVDPEIYAKFGRTPPEDIRTLLKLDLVETETGSIDIHIGNQRYPIFLLDQTGSQAAAFFAASSEAEYLLKVQQALKTKTDRARSKRKELLQECAELDEALKPFLPLPDLALSLSAVEELYGRLVCLQQSLPALQQGLDALEEIGAHHVRKVTVLEALDSLAVPPEVHDTADLEHIVRDLQGVVDQLGRTLAGTEILGALASPPELQESAHLEAMIQNLEDNLSILSRQHREGNALEPLETPPVLNETRPLEETTGDMASWTTSLQWAAALEAILEASMEPPETKATASLLNLIEQWDASLRLLLFHVSRERAFEGLQGPPEPHLLRSLEELVAASDDVMSRLRRTHMQSVVLSDLLACPEPAPVAEGGEILQRMTLITGQIDANMRLMEELEADMAEKRREIEEMIRDLGLCPLCGHVLDLQHFLEAAHG